MKKRTNTIKWLAVGAAFLLTGCGAESDKTGTSAADQNQNEKDRQALHVGASNVPHAEILEFVKPLLAEEGIDLEITTYNDYKLPNIALDQGDIDANYFQHVPYFEQEIADNGYDFANAGGIHIEPLGAYSKRFESLEDLPEGAKILASSSTSDHGRVLGILQDAGLIKVSKDVELTTASFEDIEENPKNLQFEYEFDPALMPTLLEEDEGDVVFINSNFAVDHDLTPTEDAIALENLSSPYANIIAVRSEDKDDPAINKLVEILHSEKTKKFLEETWKGSVVPVDK